MRTKNYLLCVVIAAALLVGCDDEMPDYYDSRSYDLENFDAVALGEALQVEIIRGDEFSVVAMGETRDLSDLILRVEDGVLTGHYRQGSRNHKRTRVVIYMPRLRGVQMKAATDTEVSGFNIVEDPFFLRLSGASAANIEADFKVLEVRIEGASELILKGEADVLDVVAGGASRLDARALEARDVTVQVNGASEALINVTEQLEGSVQGSSLLRYLGNPQLLDVEVATDSRMSRL